MRQCRVLFVLISLAAATPLAGQSAVLAGTVRDDSTGHPIAGAEVVIDALGRLAVTNQAGHYVLAGLPPGLRQVLIRRIGYQALGVMVHLVGGDTLRTDVRLQPTVVQLDPVEVTAPGAPRPRGIGREAFEERRRLGFGRFVDSAEMRRNEHLRLSDVLQRHGIAALASGLGRVLPFNPRWRNSSGQLICLMQVYVAGILLFPGGNIDIDGGLVGRATDLRSLLGVSEVEAVEIYRRGSEVPPEYGGATAQCGVILLWTRRGP